MEKIYTNDVIPWSLLLLQLNNMERVYTAKYKNHALTLWMQLRRYPGSEADLVKSERTESSIQKQPGQGKVVLNLMQLKL